MYGFTKGSPHIQMRRALFLPDSLKVIMKFWYAPVVIFGTFVFAPLGHTQQAVPPRADQPSSPAATSAKVDSPAQQRIEAAKRQVLATPQKVQAFNDLAIAYLRRARETADPKYYTDASQALAHGFHLDANDFQLQKTQIALLLGMQQFAQAKEKATLLNRRTPDDVMTYGYLAEAEIALGDYPEAEKNAQWMLNMRPNNVPGLLLGARLRVLFGDPNGALQLLKLAYAETSPTEIEELAWLANGIASVQIDSGNAGAALPILQRAEQLFPEYPYTIENLARVRLAQNQPKDAVVLLKQATLLDSNPGTLYELAKAQKAAGQIAEARATDAEFAQRALQPANQTDATTLRDLVLLYAGDPSEATAALTVAQHAIDTRHDIDTLDAYAWALYANGRYSDADTAIQRAISIGEQNAEIFDHAGHIAKKLGKPTDAVKYFELSMRANSASEYAADARSAMGLTVNATDHGPASSSKAAAAFALEAPPPSLGASIPPSTELHPVSTKLGPVVSGLSFSPIPQALLTPHPTETARLIRNAQANVERNPRDAQAYAALGAEYFQQARETGDVSDYELAEKSLNLSLDLVSADFSADAALGSLAEVCMGEHRFADALTYSHKALALGSGDVSPFAIVGDAEADMGEYDKAGLAYARLTPRDMSLSPRAAYARDSRISYLNFVSGDTAGAITLMTTAVAEGLEAQLPRENLAWLYYELGEYETQGGDAAAANTAYLAALDVHPGDYRALAGLAKLRANNARYAEAITLYEKAIAVVPMPVFVAELGDLYAKTGDGAQAKKQYQLVQYIGLLGHINQVLHNRDLALFYADHDMKLPEALELARKEFEVRHDVYTWDALAWALYKNGQFAEARKASDTALAHGTQDSLLLFHAGLIADKLGDGDAARKDLTEALQINPHFHLLFASVARQRLASLNAQSASHTTAENHAR